jgi:outer membrane protein TolC
LRWTKRPRSPFRVLGTALSWLAVLCAIWSPCGCATSEKKLVYIGKPGPADYRETVLNIEDPDDPATVDPVWVVSKPRTAAERSQDEIWDLSLMEVIHLALTNNRVARTRNEFQSPGNPILQNPEGVSSNLDPAIRETGFLFGNRGVESALSAFDPLLQGNVTFGNSAVVQNNPVLSGGIPAGHVLLQDTAQAQVGITKNMAYGAIVGVSQTWNYTDSNQPFQLFPSLYTGNILFNYTQNLWAGGGTEFNRIAGPLGNNIQGVSGLNQGVIISRINTDITLADFQTQVRNMVHDVEELYWDLYLAYQNYDALVTSRDTALKIWRSINAKAGAGLTGGGRSEEAQARENYYEARGRAEAALEGPPGRGGEQGIYGIELQLRRICGLPANDGRIIRPSDDPVLAHCTNNWEMCLATALTKREELRKQRWIIRNVELQLRAAKNLANPQLNFVSSYQINGFGKRLFGDNGAPGTPGEFLQNYNRNLFSADQTQWQVGLQFSMPIGLRNAHTTVRNTELRLMKSQAVLDAQEMEVGHELHAAFQSIEYWYKNTETNYNRRQAAYDNLQAVRSEFDVDRKSLDLLLQAQNRMTVADIAFYRSLIEYNKALSDLQLRMGTLLDYNNIHLAEREWVPEAKPDALRRAWARRYAVDALPIDPVHAEPEEFPIRQEGVQPTFAPPPTVEPPVYIAPPAAPPIPEAPQPAPQAARPTSPAARPTPDSQASTTKIKLPRSLPRTDRLPEPQEDPDLAEDLDFADDAPCAGDRRNWGSTKP